jgi:hypothetical protein
MLGDAVSKRPVFERGLQQRDKNIFFTHTLLGSEKLGDSLKQRFLLYCRYAGRCVGQCDFQSGPRIERARLARVPWRFP